jgi:PAS domain S-box-containing protein
MGVLSELASRELAELLLQEPGVGRCLVAPDGRVVRANDEWLRSTGLTGETVVGADIVALFPHTRDLARALHARARLGHRVAVPRHVQRIQGRDTCWDGSIAPVPMDGGIGLLITAREVSPADTTDAAPRAAPDIAPDPPPPSAGRATFCTAVLAGRELRYTFVNAGYRHIAPDTPMLGRRFRDVFPQAAAAGAEERFLRVLETGETWCIDAYRAAIPSDPEATWEGEAVRLPTTEGEPPSVAVFVVEVTDRVRLQRALDRREEELRQAQDQLRKTIERISDGVLVLDRDWRYTLVSERAARIVGIPRERLLGGCVWELFPHARGTKFHEGYRRAMDTGEPVHFEEYYPAPLDMWIECHCYPSPDELTVYFRDVTDRRRTDEALRESNALLRAISDTSADAIFAKDRAGRLRFANPATLGALIGKPLDAVLGRTDAEILEDRAVAQTIMANDRRIMESGETAELEEAVSLPDGATRIWWSRKVPFHDAHGTVVGLLGVSRDITERKAADASLRADAERLAAVLKAQREIAALGSEGGAFLHAVLARTADLAGAEGACLEMREGEELVYAAACGLAEGFVGLRLDIARSFSGRCLTSRTVQRCDDSERDPRVDRAACRRVGLRAMVATPLRYGDDLFGVLKLMSSRVGAFDAATEHTLGLMGEFLGATIARKRAEEALREADRRKDAFLAMLGHELRNPLAPIRNSLYLLERTAPGGESTRRAHAVIDRQVTHLTRLVDDLLDVTRIARGKITLEREPLELGGLVRGTLEDYRETFAQSRLALTLALPEEALWVSADRTRLAQVIGNLLGNAAKFTPPGGRVSVSLDSDGHSGQAVLRVCDTGIGIAPELLARVFEPFAQADTTLERSRGGLGLGLATVKGLVELHGGRVGVQSAGLGAGTELTVRLPLARVERPAQTPPARRSSAGERRHVLVIEDNRDAAESLRLLLELLGHRVDVAHAGSEGLEMARALGPELILCDIGLPEMDGYAVARTLREDPRLQPSTLVAISGYAAPEDIAKSREAGFDAHLAKPVELTKLEGLLGAARRGEGAA